MPSTTVSQQRDSDGFVPCNEEPEQRREDEMSVIFFVVWLALSAVGLVGRTAAAPHAAGAQPTGEGCFAAVGASCSYRAHPTGGIQAVGTGWSVQIVRANRTITVGPNDWKDVAGRSVDAGRLIEPGDRVTARTAPGPYQTAAVRVGTPVGDR